MHPMHCTFLPFSLFASFFWISWVLPSVQAAPTTHDISENSPIVYYHGTWTTENRTDSNGQTSSYRSTTNPGSDFVFCFNGSQIEYYGVPGATNAKFRIELDGKVINSTSFTPASKSKSGSGSGSNAKREDGGASLDGSSGFYNQSLLFFQDGLSDKQHTFTITHNDESGKRLTLDRLTVTMPDPNAPATTADPTPSLVPSTPSSVESPPPDSSPSSTSNPKKTGVILGAVFGSVIGVALIIALGLWYIRRQSAKARRRRLGISGTGTGTGTGTFTGTGTYTGSQSYSKSKGQYGYEDVKVAMPHLYNQFKSKLGNAKSGTGPNTGSQAVSSADKDASMNPSAAIKISPTPMVPYQIPPPPPVLLSSGASTHSSSNPNPSPYGRTQGHGKSMSLDQVSIHKDLPLTPPPSPPRPVDSHSAGAVNLNSAINFPGTSRGNGSGSGGGSGSATAATAAFPTTAASSSSHPFGSSYQNHPYAPFAHEYTRYRSNSQPSISSHGHGKGATAATGTGTDHYLRSISGHGSTTSLSYYPDATSADGLAQSYTENPMARSDSRASSRSKRFSNQLFSR